MTMDTPVLRTFIAYVEDLPGVLNRVASLFRRREYNIESLTVGRAHLPGVSRMTVVMEADADAARRIEATLYKLVNVLYVEDITHAEPVIRDLALIKVQATAETVPTIAQLCSVFSARVADMCADSVIVEVTGTQDKIECLLRALKPHGVLEMVSSGAIAMKRGNHAPINEIAGGAGQKSDAPTDDKPEAAA
jgi:acetolactate synthase I/III small subunit